MSSRRPVRQLLLAVLLGVLVGGGLMAVTPAGAEVSQAATSWKKIWKKELKPLAAKAFYTKSRANQTFATKSESAAGDAAANAATDSKLDSYYKKTESDARYAGAGSSYAKAESDGRYLPKQALVRGQYTAIGTAGSAGDWVGNSIDFGVTLSAAPTPHYLEVGDAPTTDCPGTAAAPNAAPGQLCFYESQDINSTGPIVFDAGPAAFGAATYGASVYVSSAAAGDVFVYGSWAVRPLGITAAPRPGGGTPAPATPSVP